MAHSWAATVEVKRTFMNELRGYISFSVQCDKYRSSNNWFDKTKM